MSALKDCDWLRRPALIVGGGHSLRGFDWSRVARFRDGGGRVVAINRAAESVPHDVWFGMDSSFWRKVVPTLRSDTPGIRAWVDPGDKRPDGVDFVAACAAPREAPNRHAALAWGRSFTHGIGCGGNSGFAALNLADILGADPIYLLGFDMKGEGGVVTHFHDGYAEKAPSDSICDRWLESFRWASERVRAKVVVLEVEPGDSRLDCFPKQSAKEVL